MISCFSDRFEQEGYQIYNKLEQLLLSGGQAELCEGDNDVVFSLHSEGLLKDDLLVQLQSFRLGESVKSSIYSMSLLVMNIRQQIDTTQTYRLTTATSACSNRKKFQPTT